MSSGVVTIYNSHIVSLEGCLAWKHHCLSQRYRGNKQTNLFLSFVEFKKDRYTAADSNSEAMVCNIAQICIRNNSIQHTPPLMYYSFINRTYENYQKHRRDLSFPFLKSAWKNTNSYKWENIFLDELWEHAHMPMNAVRSLSS